MPNPSAKTGQHRLKELSLRPQVETCKTTLELGHTQRLGGFPAHQKTQITAWIRVSSIRNWNSSPDSTLDRETLSKKILPKRPNVAGVILEDQISCWNKEITERIKAGLFALAASRVPMADILPYDPTGILAMTASLFCVHRTTNLPHDGQPIPVSNPLPRL